MDISGTWVDANPGRGAFVSDVRRASGQIRQGESILPPSTLERVEEPPSAMNWWEYHRLLWVAPTLSRPMAKTNCSPTSITSSRRGYLRKVAKLPVLLGEGLYFNGLFEVGRVFAPPFRSQTPGDVVASLMVNTIFGPIQIGGAVGTAGHERVFFKLGRIF